MVAAQRSLYYCVNVVLNMACCGDGTELFDAHGGLKIPNSITKSTLIIFSHKCGPGEGWRSLFDGEKYDLGLTSPGTGRCIIINMQQASTWSPPQ
jgi:hypothetical protein